MQIARRIENYKYIMNYTPKAKIIRTTSDKFLQSQGLTNWADRENMKAVSKAISEMTADNSTLEEIEKAANNAFAKRMVLSTPLQQISSRLHEIEEQIPIIKKYNKFLLFHKKYRSLEGRAKKKYGNDYSYELDEYADTFQKMKEMFPNGKAPTLQNLQEERSSLEKEYQEK